MPHVVLLEDEPDFRQELALFLLKHRCGHRVAAQKIDLGADDAQGMQTDGGLMDAWRP